MESWDDKFERLLERDWYSAKRFLNKHFWRSNRWPPKYWKFFLPQRFWR